jgi:hypothetical protein
MPGFDRTGPEGQGPRTGRQMGRCAPREKKKENNNNVNANGPDAGATESEDFVGRGFRWFGGRGPGRSSGHGTGRGMGRGAGRHRRRKGGNW